ncbi:MAG: helix-hairpin-helix domain-containing protein [Methanoregula sp.]|jgi:endonuclease-3 related protein
MSAYSSGKPQKIVGILSRTYGNIPWWPGDADEVMIGAILTQQTRWENVEQALCTLKDKGICSVSAIYSVDQQEIESAVRCTGFFRIKARRLKALASFVMDTYGSVGNMAAVPTGQLRKGLLSVNGIGEETADSILCYGFSRPGFVIDAYTERIVRCAGITVKRSDLKALFDRALPEDPAVHRQAHAHMVEYAKEFCAKKRCDQCQIRDLNG